MALEADGSTVVEGNYAPFSLQTMLSDAMDDIDKGPIIDTNPVFDFTFVLPPLKTYSLYMTKDPADSDKIEPGDKYKINFKFQFDD